MIKPFLLFWLTCNTCLANLFLFIDGDNKPHITFYDKNTGGIHIDYDLTPVKAADLTPLLLEISNGKGYFMKVQFEFCDYNLPVVCNIVKDENGKVKKIKIDGKNVNYYEFELNENLKKLYDYITDKKERNWHITIFRATLNKEGNGDLVLKIYDFKYEPEYHPEVEPGLVFDSSFKKDFYLNIKKQEDLKEKKRDFCEQLFGAISKII